MRIRWNGHEFELSPGRAIHWPARRALLVADLHLDKDGFFRRAGIPVPAGSAAATLERLESCITQAAAQRIYILGDLLHGPGQIDPGLVARFAGWRAAHPQLEITLIRGNHDRRAGDPPRSWGIECIPAALDVDGLSLVHDPADARATAATLAGHLHPAAVLREPSGAALRAPCFWLREHVAILPAFGEFTGGSGVRPAPGERVFIPLEDRVIELGSAAKT